MCQVFCDFVLFKSSREWAPVVYEILFFLSQDIIQLATHFFYGNANQCQKLFICLYMLLWDNINKPQ